MEDLKSKSPAFQLYPQDWLGDLNVASMTEQEEGVYIRLICYCWTHGSLPANIEKLKRLLKDGPSHNEITLEPVLKCFTPDGNGNLIHKRLEIERLKQKEWSEKSKKGGLQAQANRRNLKGGLALVGDCLEPNGNTSSSSSSSSSLKQKSTQDKQTLVEKPVKKKSKPVFTEWDMDMSHTLFHELKKIVPSSKAPDFENWANEFRLMREVDKWSKEDIYEILCWMYSEDDFWRGQVRSPIKLRKHYEAMYAKRNSKLMGRRASL